jgi:NDP-sugar pyrophosphorylase family protein
MRPLHIILPMAGYGSRFAKVGITTPKPLIPVDGQPMFLKAISSFGGLKANKRYTVILRKEHVKEHNLAELVKQALPEVNIVITDKPATGALRDAYRAKPHLKPEEGIIVMDCDIQIGGQAYFDMIESSLSDSDKELKGGLLLFSADNPRYSYAEVDNNWNVLRTAEKQVISPYAIGGGYFISDTETFVSDADAVFAEPLGEGRPEYFMSYIFNQILKSGGNVKGALGDFISFGTPEELKHYNEKNKLA